MIRATWDGTDRTTIESLKAKGPQVIRRIVDRMNLIATRLQGHIVADKLQGQVLHHRSGKLGGSIRVINATANNDTLEADVLGGGGPAWYGRLHEYGGIFPRHTSAKFQTHGVNGRILKHRKAILQRTTATYVTIPERSFMRSSLNDMRETITTQLQAAMAEGASTP